MRLSSRLALAAFICPTLSAAASNFTALRGSAADGRRLATRVAIPGTIAATNYVSYIDTPGVPPGFAVKGGIGYIYRGEQASYQITVATAGAYSVAYSFASGTNSTVQVYLVKGTNCYGTRIGGFYQEGFKTAGWSTYAYGTSSKTFALAKGDQTVTVCFLRGSMNFGGIKFAAATGPTVAPAPTPTYPVADSSNCYSSVVWESSHGEVRLNGKPFHIKGASWSGYETGLYNLHGLWTSGVSPSTILATLAAQKVNVLRLPMSLAFALNPNALIAGYCGSCTSTKAWDTLSAVFDAAAKNGIFVLLDMHNLAPDSNSDSEVWYNSVYSEADFIKGWTNIVGKFKTKPNFFAIDLFNEPHGISSWGIPSKAATDWGAAAGRIMTAIDAAHPDFKGLFFVEGGHSNVNTVYPKASQYEHWWGGNLDGIYNYPVTPTGPNAAAIYNRMVYSPHVYGPDVWDKQSYFLDPTFPANMPKVWAVQLSHIERVSSGRASVIGEWGGSYTGKDKVLQDALVPWLKQNCMADAIFWVVNPDSGDTGGLFLGDWVNINTSKFALMATLQPNPSKMGAMALTNTKYCVSSWGAYGNPACASTIG